MNIHFNAHANSVAPSTKHGFAEFIRQAKGFATARENRTTLIGGIAFAAMLVLFVFQMQMHDELKQRVSKLEGLLLMKASNSIRMDVSQATKQQDRRASRTGVAKKQRRSR